MDNRIVELIGVGAYNKLKDSSILLVGIGGVGGTTLETLVRSGISNITIIDADVFEKSNLNRQILATERVLGKAKVEVALKRCQDINPGVKIKAINIFLNNDNIDNLGIFDYIIDACDTINTKLALINYAHKHNIKIISCMGTGKRLDPTKLKITTLNKTFNDPLAKIMRKELKNKTNKINVVFSDEKPRNNNPTISSMMMVPSTAGIYLAYYVINDIIKE